MISRVTHQTMQRSTLGNLQLNLRSMADLQARLSSGKNLSAVSDDPGAASRAMTLRAEQASLVQAKRNADDGASWLTQLDTALQGSVNVLHRVRDLTVRGANSTTAGSAAVEAIATELEGLRDSMLDLANTRLNGRPVFAGTAAGGTAFSDAAAATPYEWQGSATGSVTRRVGATTTLRVDVAGPAAYGSGTDSVFQLIDDIAADLRAGTEVSGRLTQIDDRLNTMLASLTDVGVRHSQLTDAQDALALSLQDVKGAISQIEDVDLAQTVIDLQLQEVAYQGALGATAKVLQPTLLDFLR
ncbi:flagellar hook-associated protein FlgL [Demequina sp.]|uniref:flagellar hook-associated protein FlgL n=1 Tax=Demequina sp. TaxID=2050685 RepID=UPI003A864540